MKQVYSRVCVLLLACTLFSSERIFAQLTANISSQINVTCFGASNGSATATPSGGTGPYTYAWSPSGITIATATGLSAGSYTCTITDATLATATATATITQPPVINVSTTQNNNFCNAMCNGSATAIASGGMGTYTYSWSPSGGTAPTASGLCAGTYTVTVSSPAGCTMPHSVTITQPTALNVSFSVTNATCGNNNGSITAIASGGTPPYTYSWTPSGGTWATASGLTAGCYTVTITDSNGCTATALGCVNIVNTITLSFSNTSAACGQANGAASVVASNGNAPYTYSWSTGSTNDSIFNLLAALYNVTVTDNQGCQMSGTVAINNLSGPAISFSGITNPGCYGASDGSATATASGNGPFTYSWNTTPVQTTTTATGLTSGAVFCTVTDVNSCVASASVQLNDPPQLFLGEQIISYTNCSTYGRARAWGAGGVPPYTYLWSSGSTNDTASNLPPGINSVTITDNTGCSITQSFTMYSNSASVITGRIYVDQNSNCIYDNGDLPVQGQHPYLTPYGYATTDANGIYSFYTFAGAHTVGGGSNALSPYTVPLCPVSGTQNVTMAGTCDTAYNIDFARVVLSNMQDLRVSIGMPQNPRAGFPNNIYINYWNVGTVAVSNTTVNLVYDSLLGFTSANMTPSINNIGYLEWNTGTLVPGQYGQIHVVLQVPTVQNGGWIGRPLFYSSAINPNIGDQTPLDNGDDEHRHIVNSWDPNEKISETANMDSLGRIFPSDSLLEYTIHFQNTGNDTAFNIYIEDTLSSYLNPATVIPGASSHPYTYELSGNGLMRFNFYNIMLPDSGRNQIGSNGFVKYTVKRNPNLPLGTVIDNTAYIYFDFNPAVVTNTTSNMIWLTVPLSSNELSTTGVSVFPNPTSENTTIVLSNQFAGKHNEIILTDASGRIILSEPFGNCLTRNLKLETLDAGIYLCTIISDGRNASVKKIIKQ